LKNTKRIIVITIIGVLLSGITFVYASSFDDAKSFKNSISQIGKQIQDIRKQNAKGNAFLEIGDETVTEERFKILGVTLQTDDNQKIEDFIVRNHIIRQLAKEKNINVTKSQVEEYMNELKEMIEKNDNVREKFNDYLEAFGFSYDEYWENEDVILAYNSALLIGNYRASLRDEFTGKNMINQDFNEIEKKVDKEIENIIEKEKNKIKIKRNY